MMEGGPAIDYFRYMAADEKNSLVFVSYQVRRHIRKPTEKRSP